MARNLHDRTFREVMSDPDHFLSLCQAYLPKAFQSRIDWKTVTLEKLSATWLKNIGKLGFSFEKQGDVFYSFRYKDGSDGLFLILAEHQSTADRLLALRLAVYLHLLLLEYATIKRLDKLPVAIQLVIYHGEKSPYPYPLKMRDMFADRALAKQCYLKPVLIDLNELDDTDLAGHGLIAPLEFIFKKVYQKRLTEDDITLLASLFAGAYTGENLSDPGQTVLNYGLAILDYDDTQFMDVVEQVLPQFKGEFMTIAERIRRKGMEQGMEKGFQKVALELARNGEKVSYIKKITHLPIPEIRKIIKESERNDTK